MRNTGSKAAKNEADIQDQSEEEEQILHDERDTDDYTVNNTEEPVTDYSNHETTADSQAEGTEYTEYVDDNVIGTGDQEDQSYQTDQSEQQNNPEVSEDNTGAENSQMENSDDSNTSSEEADTETPPTDEDEGERD